ncbi:15727_t:CDS:1, partial [Funneliformis geosporum]
DDRHIALNQIKENQQKQKDQYDISAIAEQFKIGDKVLVECIWLKNNFSAKLEEY